MAVEELWAQGYSEPDAGSDLANVQTKARLDGDAVGDRRPEGVDLERPLLPVVFVIARTEPGSERHHGLSFLLVPLDQDGVEIRPIEQLTGGSEFNEVFFTGARTDADLVVGEPGEGWGVAMGLLGFERGVSTLGQTGRLRPRARRRRRRWRRTNGAIDDPVVRDRLAGLKVELEVMRFNALRGLSTSRAARTRPPAAERPRSSSWCGPTGTGASARWRWTSPAPDGLTAGAGAPYDLDEWQRLFLFSRADTIYGGSDEVQRNILAERVLGLPREPKGAPSDDHRPEQPAPDYVPGHDLLAGKVVVVTAAAGAGIGAAVVRRALEEGAKAVVFSDTHERRLAEAEETLAEEFGADRVRQLVCDVTDEAQVGALLDAADELGGVDVMVNNAGLGGTANVLEMTDEQWRKVLDITLTGTFRCVRAAGQRMVAAGQEGRDRQQRLGDRLAGAGGAGPLRRGQGRRDGADPVRRDRPGAARHPGQRGVARAWRCTRSWRR